MTQFNDRVNEFKDYLAGNDQAYPDKSSKDVAFSDGANIGNWVATQRASCMSGELSQDKIDLLDAIGFKWAPTPKDFSSRIAEFKQSQNENSTEITSDGSIGEWVASMRR